MFSQFRHAVEQLAQQVPLSVVDSDHVGRRSLDLQPTARSMSPLGSGQTALRKSISAQRSSTPEPSPRPNPPPAATSRKSNLEERLRRATFAIGDASSPTTAESSRKATPSPTPNTIVQRRALSPASTPLPQSPALGPQTPSDPESSQSSLPTSKSIPPLDLDALAAAAAEMGEDTRDPIEDADGGDDENELDAQGSEGEKELFEEPEAEESSPTSSKEDSASPEPEIQTPGNEEELLEERTQSPMAQSSDVISSPPGSLSSSNKDKATVESPITEEPEQKQEVIQTKGLEEGYVEESAKVASPAASKGQPAPTLQQTLKSKGIGVEELQDRLRQVEQRFSDVSTSFKRLQAEKLAADTVLRDLTPVETIQDNVALREYLNSLNSKHEIFQEEVKRLTDKLQAHEDQLEDLRDGHRQESSVHVVQLEKLRTQLRETEALFQASEKAVAQAEATLAAQKSAMEQLQAEAEKLKTTAKEEEEKRVKAISLLKTVRQKLVRAEREKEDALREVAASKDRDRGDKERDHVEKLKLQQEIETLQIEKERFAAAQKAQFDRELALTKERYEKELSAVKGQLELDIITLKSSHSKEMAAKSSQITTLENSLNNVTRDKNNLFEQLQLKQAEAESAQGHLESLQHQNTELEFQLREGGDRLALLREEYTEYQREQEAQSREPTTSAADVAQMISATESKYELRLAEVNRTLAVLEKERGESEASWSRKLKEKVRQLDELKRVLGTAAKSHEEEVGLVGQLRVDLARSEEEVRVLRERVSEVPGLQERIQELQLSMKEREQELGQRLASMEKHAEESKNREAQLKQANKTLREELRKVQSSAALLERQRNPGVGYWTRGGDNSSDPGAVPPLSSSSSSPSTPRVDSPAPGSSSATNKDEEEVNLEYLRNVILQFLEHKEMRPNLVKVISIILHFTPQETRRLMAKV